MGIKMQVSYSSEEELQCLIRQLGESTIHIKRKGEQSGKYKKAYITLKSDLEKLA